MGGCDVALMCTVPRGIDAPGMYTCHTVIHFLEYLFARLCLKIIQYNIVLCTGDGQMLMLVRGLQRM